MKKIHNYILLIFLILLLFSCKNNNTSKCKPRYFVPQDTLIVSIYDLENKIIKIPYEMRDSLRNCFLAMDDNDWFKYINVINKNISDYYNPFVIILFLDKNFKKHDTLSINDIVGIQKYTITNDSSLLFHKVFYRRNNYFLENTKFSCVTTGINWTAMDIFGKYFFKYNNVKYQNSTHITLYRKSFSSFYSNRDLENILAKRIIKFRHQK